MPTLEEVLMEIRIRMEERLEAKAQWGRNELKLELERAISDALATYIDPT